MKKLPSTIIFFCLTKVLFATHLIGFQSSSRCLGNNQYELTFIIYRDCSSSGASFDSPMECAIYRQENGSFNYFSAFQINLANTEAVNAPSLSGLCLQKGTYLSIRTLPPGRYTAVYQRCCLAVDVANVAFPAEEGFSVTTEIYAENNVCNETPLLSDLPFTAKIFQPFTYTPVVQEMDGDSLVFSLCEVQSGGGPLLNQPGLTGCDGAKPTPPCSPPFDTVKFAGAYSGSLPVNSDPPIHINPATGILTCVPQQLGRFLIGICIAEYRNDTLINTSRIAFVLNVYDAFVSINETAPSRRVNILQSNGELEIAWPDVPEDVKRILILDATGRILKTAAPGQGSTRLILTLKGIPTGVLFVQTEWSDGKTSSKAFVKD